MTSSGHTGCSRSLTGSCCWGFNGTGSNQVGVSGTVHWFVSFSSCGPSTDQTWVFFSDLLWFLFLFIFCFSPQKHLKWLKSSKDLKTFNPPFLLSSHKLRPPRGPGLPGRAAETHPLEDVAQNAQTELWES